MARLSLERAAEPRSVVLVFGGYRTAQLRFRKTIRHPRRFIVQARSTRDRARFRIILRAGIGRQLSNGCAHPQRVDALSAQMLKALQAVAERLSQGLKFFLEVAPVADSRGVHRLAHLFGACRAHGPPRLMKREASRLEGQPAEIEEVT